MLAQLQTFDGAILLWIQDFIRNVPFNPVVEWYTSLGNMGFLWIALSLLMLCFRPTRKAGAVGLLAMAFGLLCTNVVLKHLVARPRPWLDVAGLIPLISEPDPYSFPSGHTCSAFAAAVAWWKMLPKRWMRMIGIVLAVCMGLSRLYVGVHYPSDVFAGALVGSACAYMACKVFSLVYKK